jgi:hypothetical protein
MAKATNTKFLGKPFKEIIKQEQPAQIAPSAITVQPANIATLAGVTETLGSNHTKGGAVFNAYNPRTDENITAAGGGFQVTTGAGMTAASTSTWIFNFGRLIRMLNTYVVIQFDATANNMTITGSLSKDGNNYQNFFTKNATGGGNETFEFFADSAVYQYLRLQLSNVAGAGANQRANIKALVCVPEIDQ